MFASIILAGGDSSKIGENKALLKINDRTLIEVIIDKLSKISSKVYIVTQDKNEFNFLKNVEIIEDYPVNKKNNDLMLNDSIINLSFTEKPKNILNAIYTGLNTSEYKDNFICACDMPSLNTNLINYIYSLKSQYDAIIPTIENKPIILHSFYNKSSLKAMKTTLDQGSKQVKRIFRDLNVKYIPETALRIDDPELKSFFHIKTRLDYILAHADFSDF